MYDVNDVFEHIRAHQEAVMVLGAVTMIAALVWYVESVRVSYRDKVVSMPLIAVFGWFGHDWSYVLRGREWFATGFWFPIGFWFFMIPLVIIEVIWVGQILRYGRDEFAPTLSPTVFTASVLAAVAGGAGVWIGMKAGLADPLYILSMHLTVALYGAGGIMLTLRRRSRVGQSLLMWIACLTMFATWSTTSILFLGDSFEDWRWITLSATITIWVAAGAVLFYRMPRPEIDDHPAAAPDSRTVTEASPAGARAS